AAVEGEGEDVAAFQPHGALGAAGGEAGGGLRHDEGRDAAVGLARVGDGVDDEEVGHAAVRDEALGPLEVPAAVGAAGAGLHVGAVGAGGRLGQGGGAEAPAVGRGGEVGLPLRLGAADEDRVGGEIVRGQRRGGGAAGTGDDRDGAEEGRGGNAAA